jgi:hypothetical protein
VQGWVALQRVFRPLVARQWVCHSLRRNGIGCRSLDHNERRHALDVRLLLSVVEEVSQSTAHKKHGQLTS